jgi:putative DNA methylase
VIFASLVDDPASRPDAFPTEEDQARERARLFRLVESLVDWPRSNDQRLLADAHAEIVASTGGELPTIMDPFCGGGSIPLEAQRLGLSGLASDLNPVAVLITRALTQFPPRLESRISAR